MTPFPLQKTDISNRYSLVAPQPLHLAKKGSIITNRRSTTGFPMSLRWTAYVAPKPPKGLKKRKPSVFRIKVDFFRRKSATKFLCVKTFNGKIVKHSLAYVSVHKWLVGDVASYLKCWAKLTNSLPLPLEKRRFRIDIRINHYTEKKSSIITNRKITTGFLMNLRWTATLRLSAHPAARSLCDSWFSCFFLAIRRFRPFPLMVLSLMAVLNCTILLYDVLCNRIQ